MGNTQFHDNNSNEVNMIKEIKISKDFDQESKNFNKEGKLSPFKNSGVMIDGKILTNKSSAIYDSRLVTLGDILEDEPVADEFYINKSKPVKKGGISIIYYLNKNDPM